MENRMRTTYLHPGILKSFIYLLIASQFYSITTTVCAHEAQAVALPDTIRTDSAFFHQSQQAFLAIKHTLYNTQSITFSNDSVIVTIPAGTQQINRLFRVPGMEKIVAHRVAGLQSARESDAKAAVAHASATITDILDKIDGPTDIIIKICIEFIDPSSGSLLPYFCVVAIPSTNIPGTHEKSTLTNKTFACFIDFVPYATNDPQRSTMAQNNALPLPLMSPEGEIANTTVLSALIESSPFSAASPPEKTFAFYSPESQQQAVSNHSPSGNTHQLSNSLATSNTVSQHHDNISHSSEDAFTQSEELPDPSRSLFEGKFPLVTNGLMGPGPDRNDDSHDYSHFTRTQLPNPEPNTDPEIRTSYGDDFGRERDE